MMLTLPTIVFALVAALLLGALYHAIRGGSGWRLLFYFSLSIFGFIAGHYLGVWQSWNFLLVGPLNLGMGIPGSIVFLIGGEWLSRVEVNK